MNRHQLSALARGTVAVVAGGALLYAAGRYLGRWLVAGFAALAIADFVWCTLQLPARWRPW